MSLEFVLKCEVASRPVIELDINVSSNCEGLPVGGEGVIGDRVMEKVVDFWTGHVELICMR
jgi:hypothetical protein